MTTEGVRKFIAELISDEAFKEAFFANPNQTIKDSGYDISAQEKTALKKLDKNKMNLNIRLLPGDVFSFDVG